MRFCTTARCYERPCQDQGPVLRECSSLVGARNHRFINRGHICKRNTETLQPGGDGGELPSSCRLEGSDIMLLLFLIYSGCEARPSSRWTCIGRTVGCRDGEDLS